MSHLSAARFGGRALQMMGRTIRNLYYITHLDNVPSILRHGILSHEEIQSRGLAFTAIYDTAIVSRRSQISVPVRSRGGHQSWAA